MKQGWLEGILNTIADKGRDILSSRPKLDLRNPRKLSMELALGHHGEASGVALARELLSIYSAMNSDEKLAFFRMLEADFGPDKEAIKITSEKYLKTFSSDDYLSLVTAVEAKRQELFRRLNLAPRGTADLVRMRADLVGFTKKYPELKVVDADLKHLLSSWFNRGFLQIRSISWDSPASVLDKLIAYEAVHAMNGFGDLRRRLSDDRRCFAFFHPAMPGEPLIFVEVALVNGIASAIAPLVDCDSPIGDWKKADTAIFYSINNSQTGLRGISFGNFLIKQVVQELTQELPQLKQFCTLSPLPRFVSTMKSTLEGDKPLMDPPVVKAVLELHKDELKKLAPALPLEEIFLRILDGKIVEPDNSLNEMFTHLALVYLTARGPRGPIDPVAKFHLSNGASLKAINPKANLTENGMSISHGLMVNYLYQLDEVEKNHENFMSNGKVALSTRLSRMEMRLRNEHTRRKRVEKPSKS